MPAFAGFVLAVALAAPAAPARAACSKPMTMVAEHYPPYLFEDPAEPGLDVKLARAIFEEAGCQLIVAPAMPPLARWDYFAQGKFDVMTGVSDVAERRSFARFSLPYRQERVAVFMRAADAATLGDVDSFESMRERHLTMLVPRTGWYGSEYESRKAALMSAGVLTEFTTINQGVQRLKAGRAAFIMADEVTVRYECERFSVRVRALPIRVNDAPVHLILSKASTTEDDIARLNAAIARLEARGALEAIRRPYSLR
ncbi:MAG: transporter substrate-binding domain-containing protein [Pseudomonadota bacterium]